MANGGKIAGGSKDSGGKKKGKSECTNEDVCAYLAEVSDHLKKLQTWLKTQPGGDKTGGPPPPAWP